MIVFRHLIKGLIVQVMLFCVACTVFHEAPAAETKDRWELKPGVRVYRDSELYKYIDGGAELYLKTGFRKAEIREFVSRNNPDPIEAEVYEMKDAGGAKTVYLKHKAQGEKLLKIGDEGRYYPGVLELRKGRYFVRIFSYGELKDERAIFTDIAGRVMKLLK